MALLSRSGVGILHRVALNAAIGKVIVDSFKCALRPFARVLDFTRRVWKVSFGLAWLIVQHKTKNNFV